MTYVTISYTPCKRQNTLLQSFEGALNLPMGATSKHFKKIRDVNHRHQWKSCLINAFWHSIISTLTAPIPLNSKREPSMPSTKHSPLFSTHVKSNIADVFSPSADILMAYEIWDNQLSWFMEHFSFKDHRLNILNLTNAAKQPEFARISLNASIVLDYVYI